MCEKPLSSKGNHASTEAFKIVQQCIEMKGAAETRGGENVFDYLMLAHCILHINLNTVDAFLLGVYMLAEV